MATLDKELLRPIHLDDDEVDPFDIPEADDLEKKKILEDDEEIIEEEDEEDAAPEPAFDDDEESI